MFDLETTAIVGVFAIRPVIRRNARSCLVKTVYNGWFESFGVAADFIEQYNSVSHKNVLRGPHFQAPPHDQYKSATCLKGDILDVVSGMCREQPTFRHHLRLVLTGEAANSVYISKGCAHGVYVRSQGATLLYNVSSYYAPQSDGGVKWNTVGVTSPSNSPQISDRDGALPSFPCLEKPF